MISELQTPELIREAIGVQGKMLVEEAGVDERVRAGEDRSTVERECDLWEGDSDVYWELHDVMGERITELEDEAARMPLRLANELLDLRWRRSDLRWEIESILRSEDQVAKAREDLGNCEERIKEIEELLALMGPGPCAPSLELVAAGSASLLPSAAEADLADER